MTCGPPVHKWVLLSICLSISDQVSSLSVLIASQLYIYLIIKDGRIRQSKPHKSYTWTCSSEICSIDLTCGPPTHMWVLLSICLSVAEAEALEKSKKRSYHNPDLPTEICARWWENGPHWNAEPQGKEKSPVRLDRGEDLITPCQRIQCLIGSTIASSCQRIQGLRKSSYNRP